MVIISNTILELLHVSFFKSNNQNYGDHEANCQKCKQRSSYSAEVWWPRNVKIQVQAFFFKKKKCLLFAISILKNDISLITCTIKATADLDYFGNMQK